ncbi:MAG: hypothetical protein HC890_07845 [Chloroflexaceae bacterium]|nr:hypothetical protein [Chloroflexaceae bacterium]
MLTSISIQSSLEFRCLHLLVSAIAQERPLAVEVSFSIITRRPAHTRSPVSSVAASELCAQFGQSIGQSITVATVATVATIAAVPAVAIIAGITA